MFIRSILLIALVAGVAFATEVEDLVDDSAEDLVEIVLADGSVIRGRLVEETQDTVVLETDSAGRLFLDRRNVR